MNYQDLVDSLNPDLVDRLRRAVETGRWPDGSSVTAAQRENSLQAVIAWDEAHRSPVDRVGFIDRGRKARSEQDTLRWVSDEAERGA